MSAAAVASRSTQRNSSLTPSRMANNSSVDSKKSLLKHDDAGRKGSPVKNSTEPPSKASSDSGKKDKTESSNGTAKPLAPPPRPGQASGTDTPDYFSGMHNNTSAFALEPNPFEQSFGGSSETPGKSLLPSVAALASPSSLLAGGPTSTGYSWSNSLRAGPLSPAMLTGPAGGNDIFDSHFKSFPTPNESSLRTGLTPGGGGSMFPLSSPNPLFGSLTGGGATPGTLDFHRTAMSAAAAASRGKESSTIPTTSVPSTFELISSLDRPNATATAGSAQSKNMAEMFGHGDANDAANGLFMLAQARATTASNDNKHALKTASPDGSASESGKSDTKPVTRSRGKKPTAKKAAAAAAAAAITPAAPATRRKADSFVGKAPAAKKAKSAIEEEDDDDDMDMDDDDDDDNMPAGKDTRKMTDEEKRKNFLERNRVAALKCRQRKKQWLANLQSKVELYSTENDALNAQVASLRQEVMNLKTLLLAHKDCPVTQSQGLTTMNLGPMGGDFSQHPYNIAMSNRPPVMAGQNVGRRFS